MDITDVNVKLVEGGEERLKASCTVIIDGEFVIRDVKVIEGTNGLFVAMPSRKLTDHCPRCRHKNHLRARYCNHCGQQLNENRATQGRARSIQLHAEVAHPINSSCRSRLQTGVLEAYEDALSHSRSGDRRPPRRREEEYVHEHDAEHDTERDTERDTETDGETMGGYDDLISELKSEAKSRRGESEDDYRADSDERDIDGDRFDLEDEDDEQESGAAQSDRQAATAPPPPAPTLPSRPAPAPIPGPSPASTSPAAQPAARADDDDFGAGIL